MIIGCYDDDALSKMESHYFHFIEFNIHIRKKLCIDVFLHKSITAIVARSVYF